MTENRLERIEKKQQELESKMEDKGKKKKFKFPMKIKALSKKADKSMTHVLVQYLTMKQQIVFKLCRIVSGIIIVINNKAHELDPKQVWRYKKHTWYIVREIDRKPVSNQDYYDVKARGDSTDEDVVLIKAVLGAVNKPSDILKNKGIILWIIGAVVTGVVIYSFVGG